MGVTARRRAKAAAGAGELLDLVALQPDGLGVLRDGTLIRALEVQAINPLVIDADAVAQRSREFTGLLARIPAGQGLAFYVHTRPLPAQEIADRLHARAQQAAAAHPGHPQLGKALERLAWCERQSILTCTRALGASQIRHLVVVPWRAPSPLLGLRVPRPERVRRVKAADHQRALGDHGRYVTQITSALDALGLAPRPLDAREYQRLLLERFAPGHPDDAWLRGLERPAFGAIADAASVSDAQALTGYLRAALCPEAIEGHSVLGIGGQPEHVLAMSGVPEQTWLGWVMALMQTPLAFTLAVHVHATDRARERVRQRHRYRRIYGVNRGAEARGRPADPEAIEREQEAQELNATLATSAGAGIYRVAIYLAQRHHDDHELLEQAKALAKDITASTDAVVDDGRFAQRALWRSTLPTGLDARRQGARYVTDHAADTIPLVGTGCGSPDSPTWIPLGYGQIARTLEGIDPFDPSHPNHLLLVAGRAGAGKTMTTNLILARALSKGATGAVIDRAGHYEFLCSLIPGAASVPIGAGAHTINPWDGQPTNDKIDYLLRLHELLIGQHDRRIDSHGFDAAQRSALITAIRRVYERCALTGEHPREQLLQEQLLARHAEAHADGDATFATTLALLAESLSPYVTDGPYAHLVDRPTTVPADAPLLVFDTRRIADSESPAALFVIAELTARRVQAQRARYLAGHDDGRPWAGRSFLVIDEAWKLLERPATGRWVNELARRSRHSALFLVAISQQLSDFKGAEGEALLSQATIRLLLAQEPDQHAFIRQALGLCEEEITAIASLQTTKREHATGYLINGDRGRGVLTLAVSDLEYWLATSDPARDEPIRHAALRQAHGDPWKALALLADPHWHQTTATTEERR